MKSALFAALLLTLALPAAAQGHGTAAAPSAPVFSGEGGGGYGSGIGFGSIAISTHSSSSTPHYQLVYAHGSNAAFVPTRFVSYAEALKLGEAALAYRPKSIAEIAAEYRAEKAKPSAPKQ
jgi:hypothetical protein